MASDGSIKISTELDTKDLEKSMDKLGGARKFSFITFFITSTFGHKFDTDFINKL